MLEWNHPWAKWFVGGKINLSTTALTVTSDVAQEQSRESFGRANRAIRTLTYLTCIARSRNLQTSSRRSGVKKGDRVANLHADDPELAIAMLACARIGAPHTVIFGGFAAQRCSTASTMPSGRGHHADGGYRRGAEVKLKPPSKKR